MRTIDALASDRRRRIAREPLVDVQLGLRRMIHHHQRDVVDEVALPQLGRDPQVVLPVARRQLIAADQHPVLGLRHAGRVLRVDSHAERRSPEEIGDEAHRLAVVGEEPRARPLEPLLGDEDISRGQLEVGLHHAVRPDDARDVDARLRSESEVNRPPGHHLFLDQESGARLHLAPDPERVDPLIAGGHVRAGEYLVPAVAGAPLPQEPDWRAAVEAGEVDPAVPVEVAGREHLDAGHAGDGVGVQLRPFVRQPDLGASGAGRGKVQRAVVVEVGEQQAVRANGGATGESVPGHHFVAIPGIPPIGDDTCSAGSGAGHGANRPACRFSITWRPPSASRSTASGSPSKSRSPQTKPRRPGMSGNGRTVRQVPSALLRATQGDAESGPTTMSRSPSISTSAAQTP